MQKFDLVESWLDNVAISHSNSNSTRVEYKNNFRLFCDLIGKTPKQIIDEYESSSDRDFKRRYAQYVRAFMSTEFKKGLSPCTIGCRQAAVKSFFKYNDLPLGHVPAAKMRVIYHNKDITHEEVNLILDASKPREKAFFSIMAQSGLRPETICLLRRKNVELDHGPPAKIDVPIEIAKGKYRGYWTFMGLEALKYLDAYLNTTPSLTKEDFLFVKQGTKRKANPKSFSGIFSRTIQKLEQKGLIEVEQKEKGKPRDIRLYNLRKFFRKYANQAGFEFVQFWMGHVIKQGQEEHYRPTDIEFHRQLYKEKAMPHLTLETPTASETAEMISSLNDNYKKEIEQLKARNIELSQKIEEMKKVDKELEHKINLVAKADKTLEQVQAQLDMEGEDIVYKKFEQHLRIKDPDLFRQYQKVLNMADDYWKTETKRIREDVIEQKKKSRNKQQT